MTGLNKYDDKRKREMRRKYHKEKDFRRPKRPTIREDIEDPFPE